MSDLKYHHNELNFQRGLIQEDWTMDDVHEYEDVSRIEEMENQEDRDADNAATMRRRLDDMIAEKRAREAEKDPFDDDYYYDDD